MIKLLWVQKNTSEISEEESLRISDAPKNDYFWGLPERQIPEPLGDTILVLLHLEQSHIVLLISDVEYAYQFLRPRSMKYSPKSKPEIKILYFL